MVATRLLFAAHTTQEPNQNVCSTHDKKWRIAHDCSMWRGQTLHFFRVSSQLCLVTYSAYNLIKFRHKNYLVRVRKRSWFWLEIPVFTCRCIYGWRYLKGLVENIWFCHQKRGWKCSWGLLKSIQWCQVSKSLKAVVPHQTYPVFSHLYVMVWVFSSVISFHVYHFVFVCFPSLSPAHLCSSQACFSLHTSSVFLWPSNCTSSPHQFGLY